MSIENVVRTWLFNPTASKLVTLFIGVAVIFAIVRICHRSVGRYVKNSEVRYRLKKGVTFLGYLVVILFAGAVFNERLGQFTVAFGVAGAGIAFALQEVIASVAGWRFLLEGSTVPATEFNLEGFAETSSTSESCALHSWNAASGFRLTNTTGESSESPTVSSSRSPYSIIPRTFHSCGMRS